MPGIVSPSRLEQGAYDSALEYWRKALAVRLNALGSNHLDVAGTHNNIAIVTRTNPPRGFWGCLWGCCSR